MFICTNTHLLNLFCVYFVWLSNVSSCKLYYVFCSQALCISIHILYVTCISVPILAVYVFGNFSNSNSNSNSILSCVQRNQKQSVVAINRTWKCLSFRAIPMLHAYLADVPVSDRNINYFVCTFQVRNKMSLHAEKSCNTNIYAIERQICSSESKKYIFYLKLFVCTFTGWKLNVSCEYTGKPVHTNHREAIKLRRV